MLVDTSGFLCTLDVRDRRHDLAFSLYRSATLRLTHNYVLSELVPLAQVRNFSRQFTLDFILEILTDEGVRVIWADEDLTQRALALLLARADKSWSLCDAVSFLLMEEYRIVDALTTDHHFDRAGFVKLLES